MKTGISVTVSSLVLLLLGSQGVFADPISYDDLWDVSQGTVVNAHSDVHHISNITNMFGNSVVDNDYFEGDNTLFRDNQLAGFSHWVEWQTRSEVLINSFNLVASHDAGNMDHRSFSDFFLYSWTGNSSDPWKKLYSYSGFGLYGAGATYTGAHQLELYATFAAVTSQKFRAEFVQYSSEGFGLSSGPRIHELDGFYDVQAVPAPAALLLGLVGLGTAGAKLRRKRIV